MHWFYGQFDTVFVNSEQYRKSWIDRGFDPEKLKILPRGLDTDLFTPARSRPEFLGTLRQQEWRGASALRRPHFARKRSRCAGGGISPTARGRFAGESVDRRRTDHTREALAETSAGSDLYRLPRRRGAGESLRFFRHLCFPEHDRHVRQRHHRSAGVRTARDCFRSRRTKRTR